MTDLPVNVDTAYADDATHPDVKLHQQHHDALHFFYNFWEQAIQDGYTGWPDGSLPFFNQATDRFELIDPAISGSPGPPGADGADGVSITPKGDWSAVTAYVVGDLVRHDDTAATYVCDTAHTNQVPPGSNWQLVANDGVNGADGSTGSTGATGPQGLTGPPGPSAEVVEEIPSSGSSQSLDLSTASFYIITLDDDCTIDLDDSLGRAASAATIHFVQGSSPNDVLWSQGITWFTSDGLKPVITTTTDDTTVVTVWQLNGVWYGVALEFGGAPPPEIYPTLGVEYLAEWVDNNDRLVGGADYTSTSNYNIGNKRVGHVFLIETRNDTDGDPGILTTLTGGGVSTWTRGASTLFVSTGTNRRRVTHFVGRDAVTTSAAPLVAHIQGESRSGCSAIVVRTTESPASAVALSLAKDVTATGVVVSVAATLGAASDAANRGLYVVARNATAATFTPEGTWVELTGSPIDQTAPVVRMHAVWRTDAFDTSITATLSAANTWGVIATELEQGPLV